MTVIAYTNPFVPPEWIAAHGVQPRWMRLGAGKGRAAVSLRRGVCPYAATVVDTVLASEDVTAVVLTTTCDQMRYAAGFLQQNGDVPVFVMNVPSTWQTVAARQLYRDELVRLGRFVERVGGIAPSAERLVDTMWRYDRARAVVLEEAPRLSARQFAEALVELRGDMATEQPGRNESAFHPLASPSSIPETSVPLALPVQGQDAIQAPALAEPVAHRLSPAQRRGKEMEEFPPENEESTSSNTTPERDAALPRGTGVPLSLVGGPLTIKDYDIFDLIEQLGGQVVLDGTEGGERTIPAKFDGQRVQDDPLGELVRAYFDTIPDVFRRPNTALHHWIDQQVRARHVRGIVFRRYVWCDLWHAELDRLRQSSHVPVLEIDVDREDDGGQARIRSRLEAFMEMLQ